MIKKYNAVRNFESDVSSSFVKGAAILTVSMIVVKVFGLLDKITLERIFSAYGDASFGMGLYSNAFEVFIVIFTVATGGLPIAISRLVSQNMTQRRYKDVRSIHKISVPFFAILGLVCMLVIMGASFPYTHYVIHSPYSVYAMVCLAPTVFFGCLASAYRGYYEGQRNMFPTAVSEIIEAVVKLVLGAAISYFVLYIGMESIKGGGNSFLWMHFRDPVEAKNTVAAFSVAGKIIGISLGSFGAFLYCYIKYKVQGDGIPDEYYTNSIDARRNRETFMMILKTGIPIAAGALVMSLGSFFDSIIIQNVLLNVNQTHTHELEMQYGIFFPPETFRGKHITIHTNLWGCYSNALTLMQLVTAVTQVFGSSAMPNVTSAWTKGDRAELRRSMNTVLKMTMLFTLPMSFGLCVLAHPIMGLIYNSESIVTIGGNVLMVMGVTTIFTAIITPICSMINGIGRVKIPMILYTICMLVKIGTSWIFVSIPSINIQGATAGSMVSYALICIIGMYLLIKYSGIVPDFFSTTVKPLIGAVFSSAAAFFGFRLLAGNHTATSVCVTVAAGLIVFALVVLAGHFISGTTPFGRHFDDKGRFIHKIVSAVIGVVAGAGAAFLVYRFVGALSPSFFNRVSTLFAILIAVVIYMAVLLIIRAFSVEEVKILPKGEKIAKTLEKLHLIG